MLPDGQRFQSEATLALVVSYDGAPFSGFARQPAQRTVQGELESALSMALRRPVETVCAGRTDAGVHALGQVVSFPLREEEADKRSLNRLTRSLNALTDDEIAVKSAALMPADFSARFSAQSREYRYFIVFGQTPAVILRNYCWQVRRDLDIEAMRAASLLLQGEHDFKSFCMAASAEGKNTVRSISSIDIEEGKCFGEKTVCVRIVGNAFLHSMVRAIVGTLVAVGCGRRNPAWVEDVLAARNRTAAGENAPARGLFFWRVSYEGGLPS